MTTTTRPSTRPVTIPDDAKKGWIEWATKRTSQYRYPRRVRWIKQDGEWTKTTPIYLTYLEPLTEEQYREFKKQHDRTKRIRRNARRQNHH